MTQWKEEWTGAVVVDVALVLSLTRWSVLYRLLQLPYHALLVNTLAGLSYFKGDISSH